MYVINVKLDTRLGAWRVLEGSKFPPNTLSHEAYNRVSAIRSHREVSTRSLAFQNKRKHDPTEVNTKAACREWAVLQVSSTETLPAFEHTVFSGTSERLRISSTSPSNDSLDKASCIFEEFVSAGMAGSSPAPRAERTSVSPNST